MHRDERGFFIESYRAVESPLPQGSEFVQDNHSRSVLGTIRGLHFQTSPGQSKLVRVARGSIFDVVLDLRIASATFGSWEGFHLDDIDHRQLFVPAGFAHGFCVTSEIADVVYKVDSYYEPSAERGVLWNDEDLAIPWPAEQPLVSERDRANMRWSELQRLLRRGD